MHPSSRLHFSVKIHLSFAWYLWDGRDFINVVNIFQHFYNKISPLKVRLALCCRPSIYLICNYAVGKHFPLSLFQSWAQGYGVECYRYFQSWFIFSIHLLASSGKFKGLGKASEWVWECGLYKRLGRVRGSDVRLHKLCTRAVGRHNQEILLNVWCLQILYVTVGCQNTGLNFWLHFSRELFKCSK